jgi:hypothetical protein
MKVSAGIHGTRCRATKPNQKTRPLDSDLRVASQKNTAGPALNPWPERHCGILGRVALQDVEGDPVAFGGGFEVRTDVEVGHCDGGGEGVGGGERLGYGG